MSEEPLKIIRGFIETLPYGIMILDRDGQVTAMNRNCSFMLNIRSVDNLGRFYGEIIEPRLKSIIDQFVQHIKEAGFVIEHQVKVTLPGNVQIMIGISGTVLCDEQVQNYGILLIFREMTATQELERMREIDALKTDFVATVSHDLKAPLTSICGYADVLIMFSPDKFNKEEMEYLKIIKQEGLRLTRMINDMLNVAAIEAGSLSLKTELCSLKEVLHNVIRIAVLNRDRYAFSVEIGDDIPRLWLDKEQMIRVFLNLINNAVKYSPEGGGVDIKSRRLGENIYIDIIDQGMGMSPETVSRLFQKFFRADTNKIKNIKGTGLGLVITKGIVEAHGGTIAVTSEEGKGSTFSVILPISLEHHKP